jgi:hypothetical protein
MPIYKCSHCGHTIETAGRKRKPAPAADVVNTADMSHAEVFAYYKKTALLGDVRFLLRARLSPGLRADVETLERDVLAGLGRVEGYRRYVSLQDRWRGESNARERSSGRPVFGTAEWLDLEKIQDLNARDYADQMLEHYRPRAIRALLPAACLTEVSA